MSALPASIAVRASEPGTPDDAAVVALDGDGSIVGRGTLTRLYGLRAEVRIDIAPTTTITLTLIDALEREARTRGLERLELNAVALSDSTVAALRQWRPIADELRASHPYLTWSTTSVNS